MTLYGVPLSPFVRKVLLVANELGIPLDTIEVPPHSDDPDFRRISAMGRIPAFSDGAFELVDSSAISRYLIMQAGSDLMGGQNPRRQAQIVVRERFADDDLAPALTDVLIERVVKPVRLGQTTDESVVETALESRLPPVWDRLESLLADNGSWLVDGEFSYADFALGTHLASAELAAVMPDESSYPNIVAWHHRLQSLAAYSAMMTNTQECIERMKKNLSAQGPAA
ncbi:glutathione S-transferase [Kushneria avicenniae]|uniref:Glutathione S-transferase n=1 Tax=Kushneria avicenniae TaxID=402385 RepID=A0A1I1JMS8_9GAMM|nr:glutathione S-transferase family protein [Kushneria avicenniae]SFC49929.1 glutathione S-transferase [Kushneria avicenniae]